MSTDQTVGDLRADDRYIIERSGTPVDVDGYKLGAPADHIICAHCFRAADAVDDIRHARNCSNPAR